MAFGRNAIFRRAPLTLTVHSRMVDSIVKHCSENFFLFHDKHWRFHTVHSYCVPTPPFKFSRNPTPWRRFGFVEWCIWNAMSILSKLVVQMIRTTQFRDGPKHLLVIDAWWLGKRWEPFAVPNFPLSKLLGDWYWYGYRTSLRASCSVWMALILVVQRIRRGTIPRCYNERNVSYFTLVNPALKREQINIDIFYTWVAYTIFSQHF